MHARRRLQLIIMLRHPQYKNIVDALMILSPPLFPTFFSFHLYPTLSHLCIQTLRLKSFNFFKKAETINIFSKVNLTITVCMKSLNYKIIFSAFVITINGCKPDEAINPTKIFPYLAIQTRYSKYRGYPFKGTLNGQALNWQETNGLMAGLPDQSRLHQMIRVKLRAALPRY